MLGDVLSIRDAPTIIVARADFALGAGAAHEMIVTARRRRTLEKGQAGPLAGAMSRSNRQSRANVLGLALALVVLTSIVVAAVRRLDRIADQAPAAAVTVHDLATNPEAYAGRRVRATGVERVFFPGGPDEHFVVEQAGQDRVGLRGMPSAALTPFVGTPVVVEGAAGFEPGFGAAIRVERIAPLASPAPAS